MGDHQFQCLLTTQKGSTQIDGHQFIKLTDFKIGYTSESANAGIIDQDVDSAVTVRNQFEHGDNLLCIGDIGGDSGGLAAFVCNLPNDFFDFGSGSGANDHLCSCLCQSHADTAADAPSGAGHQGDSALQVGNHSNILPLALQNYDDTFWPVAISIYLVESGSCDMIFWSWAE